MTTIALDPTTLTGDELASLALAKRVRRYPGSYTSPLGWPLFKPDWELPNIPRRSTGPVHLNFDRSRHG